MKIWLNGMYAISEEFDEFEYKEFTKALSWWNKKEEKYDRLYKEKVNSSGKLTLITYTGVLKHLSTKINIEINNPKQVNQIDFNIDKNIIDGITLKDFQSHTIYKALTHGRGIAVIPTGGGKSYISIAIIKHIRKHGLGKKGIVIVPSVGLADQYYDDTLEAGCGKREFGRVHGKAKEYGADILICVINSINYALKNFNEEMIDHIKNSDFIITDEAHKISSDMYKNLYDLVNDRCKYTLFFTAEPFENEDPMSNYKDASILGVADKEIIRVENKYLIEIGFVARPIVMMCNIGGETKSFRCGYNRVYDTFIKKNKRRNAKACEYIRYFNSFKMRTLALVLKIDHARIMMELLPDLTAIAVFGGSKGLERTEPNGEIKEIKVNYNKFRKNFEKRKWDIVFGSPTMDEGFNIKSIESVVMLSGNKARRKLIQRIGRGARKKKHINYVYIVDFYDSGHIFVKNHSDQRRNIYLRHGSFLKTSEFEFKKVIEEHRRLLSKVDDDV